MNNRLFGMEVVVSQWLPDTKQIIELDVNFKWCSDEFREKQNKYLSDTFGSNMCYLTGKHPLTGRNIIITSAANALAFKNAYSNIN